MSETATPEPDPDTTTTDDDDEDEDDDERQEQTEEDTEKEGEYTSSEETSETATERPTNKPELPAPPLTPLSTLNLFGEPPSPPSAGSDPLNPDFEKMMADPELTEENLQATLNKYANAIRSEFEEATKEQEDLSRVEEYTRDFFKKNIHSAAAQIVWLSNNAESESVRLKAATTVLHEALADSRADGDPIKNLLNELTKQPAQAQQN